jgi:hypothetical protein
MLLRNIIKIFIFCLMSILSLVDADCQNDIWVVNNKNGKEFLIPKENNQTFFRVLQNKITLERNKIPSVQNKKFPIDSGYVGSPYEYKNVSQDSITLELSPIWKNSLTKYNMQYRIALSDITEIHVQGTYNKKIGRAHV